MKTLPFVGALIAILATSVPPLLSQTREERETIFLARLQISDTAYTKPQKNQLQKTEALQLRQHQNHEKFSDALRAFANGDEGAIERWGGINNTVTLPPQFTVAITPASYNTRFRQKATQTHFRQTLRPFAATISPPPQKNGLIIPGRFAEIAIMTGLGFYGTSILITEEDDRPDIDGWHWGHHLYLGEGLFVIGTLLKSNPRTWSHVRFGGKLLFALSPLMTLDDIVQHTAQLKNAAWKSPIHLAYEWSLSSKARRVTPLIYSKALEFGVLGINYGLYEGPSLGTNLRLERIGPIHLNLVGFTSLQWDKKSEIKPRLLLGGVELKVATPLVSPGVIIGWEKNINKETVKTVKLSVQLGR